MDFIAGKWAFKLQANRCGVPFYSTRLAASVCVIQLYQDEIKAIEDKINELKGQP